MIFWIFVFVIFLLWYIWRRKMSEARQKEIEKLELTAAMFTLLNSKDEQRMASALSELGNGNPMADGSKPDYNQKSESQAKSDRVRGNNVLDSEPEEALKLYTKSIAFAPEKSDALSYGYANRAVVLAAMGYNFDAIADNQRALKFGYPKNLQYKVLARLGKCYEKVGQYGRALTCLNSALEGVNNSELSEEAKRKFRADHIQPFLDACDDAGEEDEEELKDWTEEPLIGIDRMEVPTLDGDENPELLSASSSVTLKYNSQFGRHLVATKDIDIGEVIMVENPYAAILAPQKFYSMCSHCFKKSRTLQPCSVCSWAMFCSTTCKSEAESYHKLECPYFMSALHEIKRNPIDERMTIGYILSIRMITRYGIEAITNYPGPAFEKRKLKTDEEKRTAGFNKNGKYDPSDIRTILNLCHHPIENKVLVVRYCFSIAEVMRLLKFNTYDRFLTICKIFYKAITDHACNGCCALAEYNINTNDREHFGMGIYPTYALMNQNCIGNVYATFYSQTMVVRAIRTIKKGEQFFVVKGNNVFLSVPLEIRRKMNKEMHHFVCTCKACEENWDVQDKLPFMPQFIPGSERIFKTLKKSHDELLKSCTVDKDMNIIVNDKTLILLKNYIKLLEKYKKTQCGFFYNVLYWVSEYFLRQGNHIGKVNDSEIPNISEKLTPQFVLKALVQLYSQDD